MPRGGNRRPEKLEEQSFPAHPLQRSTIAVRTEVRRRQREVQHEHLMGTTSKVVIQTTLSFKIVQSLTLSHFELDPKQNFS